MSARRGRGETSRRPGRATVIVTSILVVLLVGGAVAVAYFTPLMSVRSVEVTGAKVVAVDEIRRVAQAPTGKPLLQVDTVEIADRIAVLPEIEEVTVSRSYPSTLTIDVTERVPVVTLDRDGKVEVMDRLGVSYRTFPDRKSLPREFAGLPILDTGHPGPTDPTTESVLTVAQELPPWLAERTIRIEASSPADITLVLKSGRRAVWGDDTRNADKAEALRQVSKLAGDEFNVSSPEYPAVK